MIIFKGQPSQETAWAWVGVWEEAFNLNPGVDKWVFGQKFSSDFVSSLTCNGEAVCLTFSVTVGVSKIDISASTVH